MLQANAMTHDPHTTYAFIDALETWLTQTLPWSDQVTLIQAAKYFGITERTLQRRLALQRTTFMDLRARIRMNVAHHLLSDWNLSMTVIAGRLGFSESSAFTRAFRSHTGHSPRSFRAMLSAQQAPGQNMSCPVVPGNTVASARRFDALAA